MLGVLALAALASPERRYPALDLGQPRSVQGLGLLRWGGRRDGELHLPGWSIQSLIFEPRIPEETFAALIYKCPRPYSPQTGYAEP